MRVPSGYERDTFAGVAIVVRHGLRDFVREAIETAGSLSAFAAGRAVRSLPGRGETHVVESRRGPLVVRHYRRGGAVASKLHDRYVRFGTPRPFRELWASAIARARGVTTPAVAAAVVYPSGLIYRGDIATDYVPDAITLADLTFGETRYGEDDRTAAWHETGRLVRAFAAAGFVHADLNLRNILVAWRSGRPVPWLLDLDRCRIVARVSAGDVRGMKARVRRSARRFEQRSGTPLSREWAAFEEGVRG